MVVVTSTGIVAANGGGGGGGCDMSPAQPGQDAKASADPVLGGPKQGNGSDGGDGGADTTADGGPADTPAERGGGGGAGGVGFVLVYSPNTPMLDASAVFSPPATVNP